MKKNSDFIDMVIESLILIESWHGQTIQIEEIITRTPSKSTDRHLSTRSNIVMHLEYSGCATSGARLMLLGEDSMQYEASLDAVTEVEIAPNRVEYVERYTDSYHRLTTISLVQKSEIVQK